MGTRHPLRTRGQRHGFQPCVVPLRCRYRAASVTRLSLRTLPPLPKTAAIALGSNLPSRWGAPADNLLEALHRLTALGQVLVVSSFRATDPIGYTDQPVFTNAAALLETPLEPLPLLRALLTLEHDMGRDRSGAIAKGPRIIDLDLLLYVGPEGPVTLHHPDLILPHPALHERRFVLEPLAEIAPTLVHPVLHRTVGDLFSELLRTSQDPRSGQVR